METKKLLVLASINADFNLTTKSFPKVGETVSGSQFVLSVGGKGANQAFYASQCQTDTEMLISLGDDYFSQFILDQLQTSLVKVNHQLSHVGTGKAFVFISDGDNRIILDPGANANWDQNWINHQIDQSQANYFLSVLEIPYDVVLASFKHAKTKNLITVLNPSPASISNDLIYPLTDYLVLNETEASGLSGIEVEVDNIKSYEKVCQNFLNKGVKNVLLTIGKYGSFFMNRDQQQFVPALKINPVNSTGAGDSYLGAFLSQIMIGKEIKVAMEFATNIAGWVCQNYATQVHLDLKKEELWIQN